MADRVVTLEGKQVLLVNEHSIQTKEQVEKRLAALAAAETRFVQQRAALKAETLFATRQKQLDTTIKRVQDAQTALGAVVDTLS